MILISCSLEMCQGNLKLYTSELRFEDTLHGITDALLNRTNWQNHLGEIHISCLFLFYYVGIRYSRVSFQNSNHFILFFIFVPKLENPVVGQEKDLTDTHPLKTTLHKTAYSLWHSFCLEGCFIYVLNYSWQINNTQYCTASRYIS